MSKERHIETGGRDDSMEGGLRAAFGPDSDLDVRDESIFERLEETAGPLPRIALRDIEEERVTRVPRKGSGIPERLGRYQLLGEIARGGVGAIHKARDVDLGRYLAVKILLEKHRGRPEIMRRFIEEAQIAGQLQHPGIASIYELGLHEGDLPYFAMRLVNGGTLSALLAGLSEEERQRVLGIFERVCETLAYANARGVIHRDLKPSNIMVGAFGEVQVMDWGLAKVMDRGGVADERRVVKAAVDGSAIKTIRTGSTTTESIVGSVMGTPSYMAPEQARGEIDLLDARVDVFGLGAILCEILTGKPPYTGRSSEEIHRRARDGDLDEALRRLETSGADDELVDLARRCLAVEAGDRPRDSGAVAEQVAAYNRSLEARARRSELKAAEARVKATEERKARRLTIVLAATVLVGLAIGGMALRLVERSRAREIYLATRAVERERDQAERLWELARDVEGLRLRDWELAVEAAQRARDLLTDDVEAAVRAGSEGLVERIRSEGELLRSLEEIRLAHDDERGRSAHEPAYARAFATFGIDPDVSGAAAIAVVEEFTRRGIGPQVAAALDHWAMARRRAGLTSESWKRLLSVAAAIDPDPWRMRVRQAFERDDVAQMIELARREDLFRNLSSPTQLLLVSSLIAKDLPADAEFLLTRIWQRHKDRFWVNHDLGYLALTDDPPRYDDARRYFTAAVAARPRSPHALRDLSIISRLVGDLSGASAALDEARRVEGESSTETTTARDGAVVDGKAFDVHQRVPIVGTAGGIVFDPAASERIYALRRGRTGGLFRVEYRGGAWLRGRRVSGGRLGYAIGLAFTRDGALWITSGTRLMRVARPDLPGSVAVDPVIRGFRGPKDDDPGPIVVAPERFRSDRIAPGDLIILDPASDWRLGSRSPGVSDAPEIALYAYSPEDYTESVAPETAYERVFVAPSELDRYRRYDPTDLHFSTDGTLLYMLLAQGVVLSIDSRGEVVGSLRLHGDLLFGEAVAFDLNPDDGRLWIADDSRDQIWSVDPASGESRLEISFFDPSATRLDRQAVLAGNSLAFSSDGTRLAVGDDAGGGRLWIFERRSPGRNRPPIARIVDSSEPRTVMFVRGEATLELDGRPSDDGEGRSEGLDFRWKQAGGPRGGATIVEAEAPATNVLVTQPGTYTFVLGVRDAQGATHAAQLVARIVAHRVKIGSGPGRPPRFDRQHVVRFVRGAGGVAFDSAHGDTLYALADCGEQSGGGIYRIDREAGSYRRGELVLRAHMASAIAFVPSGDLWLVRDRQTPYVSVVAGPLTELPHHSSPMIWNFRDGDDDDPSPIVVAPSGFSGAVARPGDILIGDFGFDTGYGGETPEDWGPAPDAIYLVRPTEPIVAPRSYDRFLCPPDRLKPYASSMLADLAFSRDGQRLHALYYDGRILAIDADGRVVAEPRQPGTISVDGCGALGIAVDPVDGRLWIAQHGPGGLRTVSSIDPRGGDERLELTFIKSPRARLNIDFPPASMRFSRDGRLVVSDATGWLWVFEKS